MKPGWIRLSLHPTMTNEELLYIIDAIRQSVENVAEWKNDYDYDRHTNEFNYKYSSPGVMPYLKKWFNL